MDLTQFRKDNGLRQQDIADYLGVRVSFITNIECGRCKLPEDRRLSLIDNDRGWKVDALLIPSSPSVQPRRTDEVVRLRAQVAELQDKCERYLAIIEKLTGK